MDSITHLTQKLLQERARNTVQQQPTPPETAPPPYSESDSDSEGDDDDDPFENGSEASPPPVRLVINAAHSIHGSNNLVPTLPTPLADATKFSTLLLHAVNQIHHAHGVSTSSSPKRRRAWRVDLTINCGTTIVGDRNVVGNVGVKPKAAAAAPVNATTTAAVSVPPTTSAAVAGAKRKAEELSDAGEGDHERVAKKAVVAAADD